MDEVTRALAHGQAGLDKIEAGMSGDLGRSAEYAAIEDATAEPGAAVPAPRPALALAAVVLVAVVVLILVTVR